MPVIEFCALRIKAPHVLGESQKLHDLFTSVSKLQSAWSKYPLTYYQNIKDPALIYLISGWKDVESHNAWIASDENQGLLQNFTGEVGVVEVESFSHVDKIDFNDIPSETKGMRVCKNAGIGAVESSVMDADRVWDGEGVDLESKEDDTYRFVAYGDVSTFSGEGDVVDWILMTRIEFDREQ
ncbi:hypothetical protein BJ165DRAFT_841951 [Panaeolus papilionaceus]|nr:hypothetical protein BJ165DRAFT_841951 [Panaeolus papilionaceus]